MIVKLYIILLLFVFLGIVSEENKILVGVLGMFNINIISGLIVDNLGILLFEYFIYRE